MNYTAKAYLSTAIKNTITALEEEMKSTSKLVAEAKLTPHAREYFEAQIINQREAIHELQSVYEGVESQLWKDRTK